MTRIADRRTACQAETNASYRGRPLMVRLGTHEVYIREKGRRCCYSVPWLAVYQLGAKIMANEARAAKLAARSNKNATTTLRKKSTGSEACLPRI